MKYYYSILCLTLIGAAGYAADLEKQQQLQQEIHQLSNTLETQTANSNTLEAEVTRLEKQLGNIDKQVYQTERKIETTQQRLRDTNQKKIKLEVDLNTQKTGLSQQLQAMYAAGEQSYLRLLLKQDEPSDISRTFHYFKYLNENRVKRITDVKQTLSKVEKSQVDITQNQQALNALTADLSKQKANLESTLSARSSALEKLNADISTKQKRLTALEQAEAALQNVLGRLAENQASNQPLEPSSMTSNTTPLTQGLNVQTTENVKYSARSPFSNLKGKLAWPVNGRILYPYNSRRNEKQRWTGVVIEASGGSKVKAIAKGRVVFSGWMNGYGYLVILDHDGKYMSLYGYNRAVYKREGETVKANDTIAAVGNSGGQNINALYFEIRQFTTPQNPANWCR